MLWVRLVFEWILACQVLCSCSVGRIGEAGLLCCAERLLRLAVRDIFSSAILRLLRQEAIEYLQMFTRMFAKTGATRL